MIGRKRLPPGPRISLVQGMGWLRDPIDLQERLHRRYGDVFSVPLPLAGRLVFVADPEEIGKLFTGDPRGTRLYTGEANEIPLGPLVGRHSMLTHEEEQHMRQRRRLVPLFHGERVARWSDVIVEVTDREIDSWPVGRPFEMQQTMQGLSLEALLRTVIGVYDPDRIARFRELIAQFGRVIPNMLLWMPAARYPRWRFTPWGRFLRALEKLDEWFYEEIDLRRAELARSSNGGGADEDMLSLLLSVRDDDGNPLSDAELRDEVMTMVVAGHHTVQSGLCWLFERVLRHPDAYERLRSSVEAGDDSYVVATIKETLRLKPVLPTVPRVPKQDIEVGGWTIPADTIILICIALAQRRPDVYPDPEEFRPERFLDGDQGPYDWIPWGGGVRRCLGINFAMAEMTVAVRRIVERTRLRAADPAPEATRMLSVTIGPSRGAKVVLEEPPLPRREEPAQMATAT
jgi:cytochrome P450